MSTRGANVIIGKYAISEASVDALGVCLVTNVMVTATVHRDRPHTCIRSRYSRSCRQWLSRDRYCKNKLSKVLFKLQFMKMGRLKLAQSHPAVRVSFAWSAGGPGAGMC